MKDSQKKKALKKLEKLGPEFSRNKFFEFCNTKEGKRIYFLRKHLASISNDLLKIIENGELKIFKDKNMFKFLISNNEMDYKRHVSLLKEEIEYLKKEPRIKEPFFSGNLSLRSFDVIYKKTAQS